MTQRVHDLAIRPIDQAIERIRSVYRGWTRETTIAQMRRDWDAAFENRGIAIQTEKISAAGIEGEWFAPVQALRDKAILYFHGGGFRVGSVASHRDLIARIAVASECRVLAIDYRLAPEHRFPAALNDALGAYTYLLEQQFRPSDIALAGDSAGGNLALSTMLALRDRGLPLPAAAAMMSPWTDLAATGRSYDTRAAADPIHQKPMILALAKNYLGAKTDPTHPLASPLYGELHGLPPLLIQVGDRETVLDDSVMFADKARTAGVDVDLQVWNQMIHVFQMFGDELSEAREAIDAIGKFLSRHLGTDSGRTRQ